MQKLDRIYRDNFIKVYRYILSMSGELPFKEIGKLFGKSDNWARVIYHRAKLKVKEELKDEYKM